MKKLKEIFPGNTSRKIEDEIMADRNCDDAKYLELAKKRLDNIKSGKSKVISSEEMEKRLDTRYLIKFSNGLAYQRMWDK